MYREGDTRASAPVVATGLTAERQLIVCFDTVRGIFCQVIRRVTISSRT